MYQWFSDPQLPTQGPPTPSQNCTAGTYFHYNQACYSFTDKAYAWEDAEEYCAKSANTNTSHLISIADPFEQAFVTTLLALMHLPDAVWIGLNKVLAPSNNNPPQVFSLLSGMCFVAQWQCVPMV